MWVATTYMASISVAQEVKWCWFLLSLCGLSGYLLSLVRIYKPAAEAKSEAVSEVSAPRQCRVCSGQTLRVNFASIDRALVCVQWQLYTKMVWLTVGCSAGYPLIWLFSEGFGNFSVSFEVRQSGEQA